MANTTLRTPLGGRVKTSLCSSGGMVEWIGSTHSRSADELIDLTNSSWSVVISFIPGKKTRIAEDVVSVP